MAQYDGQLMDEEELNLMCAEPVWRGFVPQTNELIMLGDGRVLNDNLRSLWRIQLFDLFNFVGVTGLSYAFGCKEREESKAVLIIMEEVLSFG